MLLHLGFACFIQCANSYLRTSASFWSQAVDRVTITMSKQNPDHEEKLGFSRLVLLGFSGFISSASGISTSMIMHTGNSVCSNNTLVEN